MLVPVAIKEGVKDFLQIKLNKEAPKVSAASVFLPDEGTRYSGVEECAVVVSFSCLSYSMRASPKSPLKHRSSQTS